MKANISDLPAPKAAQVHLRIDIQAEFNITPFVARQKANVFLLMRVGNLLSAGEPELVVDNEEFVWRLPIIYSTPSQGQLGKVGEVAVNVETGEVSLVEPGSIEQLESKVEKLFGGSALQAGEGQ